MPGEDAATYADDPRHPIASLSSVDLVARRRDGGLDLMMLVSGPLGADERSQRRLLRKFDLYLANIAAPAFLAQFGEPAPTAITISVRIDAGSDPVIFELLRRCEPWVAEAGAKLEVERQTAQVH
jgi:hypothetical protein